MKNFATFLIASICLSLVSTNILGPSGDQGTLELLHVIFRHGDRTPDPSLLYPTDPYINVTYYPVGWGELTNPGKVKAYNIGVALREKYGYFLGDVYTPSLISPTASYYSRCKATLQLVLAALFPPTGTEVWNPHLKWQPIPITYLPPAEDYIFWASTNCPNTAKFQAENQQSFAASPLYAEYADVINYLAENSGFASNYSSIALALLSTLLSEQNWGYQLPAWTDSVWPEPITTLTGLEWEVSVGGNQLRTLLGGSLMSKIVNDTYSRINNVEAVKDLKLYLYGGHDSTIATVLSWLGVFQPRQPPYGAYITIEVRKIGGRHVLKIFYQNYSTEEPQLIWIPNCGPLCPIERFVQLYEPFFDITPVCG